MHQRPLGCSGLSVSALGLGCMGMSEFYGPASQPEDALDVLNRAMELGVDFFDTAQVYGGGHNEELLGRFIAERSGKKPVVATKWGIIKRVGDYQRRIDNSREALDEAIDGSLKRLGVESIDLYYLHRAEPGRPIEDTIGLMADLVRRGKIRAIGLSEVSAATLRRAHAVHPIAALQTEYSLFTRDVETNGVLATCRELGVTFVPYAPLGRGFLTGRLAKRDDLAEGDFRRMAPRFSDEATTANTPLLERLQAFASEKGLTVGQVALAWLLNRNPDVVPIPGTRRIGYLEENTAAASVTFDEPDLARIEAIVPAGAVSGDRYPEAGMIGIES